MCSNILGLITDHWSLITSVLGRSEEISHADVLTRLKSTRINSPYVVLYKENSRKMHLKLLRLWWVWWHWWNRFMKAVLGKQIFAAHKFSKLNSTRKVATSWKVFRLDLILDFCGILGKRFVLFSTFPHHGSCMQPLLYLYLWRSLRSCRKSVLERPQKSDASQGEKNNFFFLPS